MQRRMIVDERCEYTEFRIHMHQGAFFPPQAGDQPLRETRY